jgi:glucose/mannose-6-phosphate isomerase
MALDEARLDDVEALALGDSRQVLRALATAGAQVREAVTLATEAGADRFGAGDRPRSVLVASLGGSGGSAVDDLFADPFVDGGAAPRLRLLLLRDALPEPMTPTSVAAARLADAVKMTAEDAGVRVSEQVALPGHALARLAGLVALTDFASAYLALGQGFDPAVSAHLADLRDATG